MRHSLTIRMGAAYWDARIVGSTGETLIDIRKLDRTGRGQFFGTLRDIANSRYAGPKARRQKPRRARA